MATLEKTIEPRDEEVLPAAAVEDDNKRHEVKWYRSSFYNAFILGVCNLLAPGIWGAMNSLGGGGEQKPYLVNAANALTFCLMVLSCYFSSVVVRYIGIKWAFILGTTGYAPFAAGLYTHNRFGFDWLTLLGAALCGLSAGIFWMAEAAVALSYPEPYNQGRFLGFWLSFRVGGQILGGAISLGINAHRNTAGKVSYTVFIVFIVLQALGPFVGLLLNTPAQVQRTDGVPVRLKITRGSWHELRATTRMLCSRNFLLILPLIGQAVFTEPVMFTFQGMWFSVRARALGSFLSGVVALVAGNLLGSFLDRKDISLRARSRGAFVVVLGLQGGWWIWGTVLVTEFNRTRPTYDWVDAGFGKGFALFLFWVIGFQVNYLYLYFIVGNLAKDESDVVRLSGLLRGAESASQAVGYGLSSVPIMASIGDTYLGFALWAVSLLPAWFVVKEIGVTLGDGKIERERRALDEARDSE
ncbi:hypothetical protein VTN02DRAFT_4896 [Thermoascus thermophilus]